MTVRIINGDAIDELRKMPDASVHCCVTSPPYWRQRDYGNAAQIGLEKTPEEYVDALVAVFREARRVLVNDGALWLNLGEKWASGGNGGGGSCMSQRRNTSWEHAKLARGWRSPPAGYKDKDLVGAPWMVALALRNDGWYFRQTVIWNKTRAGEPPRLDRPSTSHEYLFLLTVGPDSKVRNPGEPWFYQTVWNVVVEQAESDHPATMSKEIARRCVVCSTAPGDVVLDPFGGAGTTGLVADRLQRDAILIELNPEYAAMAEKRIHADGPLFSQVTA